MCPGATYCSLWDRIHHSLTLEETDIMHHVGSEIEFEKSNLSSLVGSDSAMAKACRHLLSQTFLICVFFLMPSTGGTVEPGEENRGRVQDLLPAPPPCRPSLLPEI